MRPILARRLQAGEAAAVALLAIGWLMVSCTSTTTRLSSSRAASSATLRGSTPISRVLTGSGIRVTDFSFVGNRGWLTGTVDCPARVSGCPALVRTVDGGATWQTLPSPPTIDEGACAGACIRFATAQIGYLFGQRWLYTTTDGGLNWVRQAGGADALEPLDGTVIRLVSDHGGCPGPCNLRVELAPLGSGDWTTVRLARHEIEVGAVQLVRTGHSAYVETLTGPAGSLYRVRLYVSPDDGRSWTERADPCRSSGAAAAGIDEASHQMATAADGSLSILCGGGGTNAERQVIITSTDGGASFTAGRRFQLGITGVVGELATPAAGIALVADGDGLYRSTNGRSWSRVLIDRSNGSGGCAFGPAGAGHCISNDRRTIWTTTDSGLTWRAAKIP
jgi:hypothetical protein